MVGKIAYVVVGRLAFGEQLAAGLERQGARVVELDDANAEGVASREWVFDAFAKTAESIGPADLVVHAAAAPAALEGADLVAMDADRFEDATDTAQRSTLRVLQAAHDQMKARGGAIIVLGPALALVGAARYVPLVTACEGQRALVKSAARQWGHNGIRVNWIGIAAERYASSLAGQGPQVPELGPPPKPLGRAPDVANEVVPLLAFLAGEGGRAITGATINLDGGDWMAP